MQDMWNVAFQNAWFGPLVTPNVHSREIFEERGEVYDIGPLDGLKSTSMWAHRFPQPVLRQNVPTMNGPKGGSIGEKPVFCRPGYIPVQTGVPGQSDCVFFEAPSAMIGGGGPNTVSKTTPPAWPTARTFPVKAFYGFQVG